jgi:HAE1 family hydrophobic/amphiphilic exporter-1
VAIPVLPMENLPDIAPPTVTVTSTYVGADAVAVEEGVTAVLEQDINGVQDMEFMTSNSSSDGVSNITVSFFSGTDGDINQVNVQNKVSIANTQVAPGGRSDGSDGGKSIQFHPRCL